ncbi:MAG: hypothetical protein A2Y28_04470 [Chlamydiae bacterium GWC2_50_10]|nr:MAG: hypothetical protein A2Y28_04470 [Chlamydiae bacterium GWC2_50_10]OGN53957.1 MAG: hypothetical protein A2098_03590 [Chlamydiae bacterium GWF2_49_8]OGN58250.1 MAG: hypothetical protein A3D18_04205 [Chlamydiae bacterium RIFCSPHIGHO2_02_FULL_49_29]OGN62604.1 MAG: hypothetical protein A3E26_04810 [Chlamydiae bacterium RIFCSPHIGHO2_12_FULL_49_32]OGN75070.1 MAG: hypothetical protein A3G30_00670 [Chlamydiae bacterium RIFCSPLOWO2_12_FULL_49_12]HAZ15191.1 hypothetical protein [Parachlamydiales 
MPEKECTHEFNFPCFIRWVVLILISLVGLYFVLPKYELMSPKYRFNKITGKVEMHVQPITSGLEIPPPGRE